MTSRFRIFFYLSLLLSIYNVGFTQDLSRVGREHPLSVSGGLSVNQILYASSGLENRRDPYNYYLGGQLNINIYGLSLPFSFTYSNQQSRFSQPFNQFSLRPKYKWVTGYLGYTSISYSPYTLNGHIFNGIALDLKPYNKLEIGLMYGRFQRAVLRDTTTNRNLPSTFRRKGLSLSIRYGDQVNYVRFILLKSSDDPQSLLKNLIQDEIKPEENLVSSIGFSKKLFDKLVIQGEFASSALTRDVNSEEVRSRELLSTLGLFTTRASSTYYSAFNTSLNYQSKQFSVGLKYEKVGADYQTHGAYYFNNDFYNISVNGNLNLIQGRTKLSGSLGVQEDNLENTKVSGSKRMVGSMAMYISANERLNFNLTYSNYTTYTNINNDYLDLAYLTPYERVDTLNYRQVARNAGLGINYRLSGKKNVQQSLMGQLIVMQTKDELAAMHQVQGYNFLTFSTGFMHSVVSSGLNINAMVNMQQNGDPTIKTNVIGPSITISKLFLDKRLRSSISGSYNRVTTAMSFGSTINSRLLISYKLKKSHRFQLSLVSVQRQRNHETVSKTSEFTGMLGYNYSIR